MVSTFTSRTHSMVRVTNGCYKAFSSATALPHSYYPHYRIGSILLTHLTCFQVAAHLEDLFMGLALRGHSRQVGTLINQPAELVNHRAPEDHLLHKAQPEISAPESLTITILARIVQRDV